MDLKGYVRTDVTLPPYVISRRRRMAKKLASSTRSKSWQIGSSLSDWGIVLIHAAVRRRSSEQNQWWRGRGWRIFLAPDQ